MARQQSGHAHRRSLLHHGWRAGRRAQVGGVRVRVVEVGAHHLVLVGVGVGERVLVLVLMLVLVRIRVLVGERVRVLGRHLLVAHEHRVGLVAGLGRGRVLVLLLLLAGLLVVGVADTRWRLERHQALHVGLLSGAGCVSGRLGLLLLLWRRRRRLAGRVYCKGVALIA